MENSDLPCVVRFYSSSEEDSTLRTAVSLRGPAESAEVIIDSEEAMFLRWVRMWGCDIFGGWRLATTGT